MVEMVDTQDLKSCSSDRVRVRVSLGAFNVRMVEMEYTIVLGTIAI